MKTFVGTVVSNRMVKSVLVSVARWKIFPKYKLRKRWTKKFMAHDEENKCNMGDTVRINMSRPISKRKAWVVTEIIRREKIYDPAAAAQAAAEQVSKMQQARQDQSLTSRGFAASAIK
ncbi:hypothetical protein ABBQ32_013889 [Trebouxia sp. C0010 RCD-2024]